MLARFKKTWIPVLAAAFCGALASTAPAQAQWGSRTVIVERPVARHVIVERPVIRRIVRHVVVERPIVRRPTVVYRVVERPAYGHRVRYGWRPHHPRHWHDRPTCRLPERWLCR